MLNFMYFLAAITILAGVLNLTGVIIISWLWFLIPVGFIVFTFGSVIYALRAMSGK
jgi:hypothetical protein